MPEFFVDNCWRGNRLGLAVRAALQPGSCAASWPRALAAACLTLATTSMAHACPTAVTSAGDPGASGLDLRTAIGLANASSGCVIQFAPSLNGSTITLHAGQIAITTPMAIIGPGADKLTISGNNASRIFYVKPPAPTTTPVSISGVTLSAGKTAGNGGAVYANGSPLVVQSSVISGNTAAQGSAIQVVSGAYARLESADFHSNTSTGAVSSTIKLSTTPATVRDCTIGGNTGSGILAAGIPDTAEVLIENSVISGNTSPGYGGGIYGDDSAGSLSVVNSTITGNSAAKGGGGVWLDYVHYATLTATQITHNSTSGNGGGVLVLDAHIVAYTHLTVVQSSISNNYAYDLGAGIDVNNAKTVTVNQSLISGNQLTDSGGASGGGIALQYVKGRTYIDNSTIYGNFAYNSGGGIGIFDAGTGTRAYISQTTISRNGTFDPPYAPGTSSGVLGSGTPAFLRCIIANNSTSHGTGTQDMSGSFFTDYTLVQHPGGATISGPGLVTAQDPQLGPLSVNGGPTLTMLPAVASPVIGAGGSPSLVSPGMNSTIDQRGLPRPSASSPDMGAVQRQYPEDIIFRNGFQ